MGGEEEKIGVLVKKEDVKQAIDGADGWRRGNRSKTKEEAERSARWQRKLWKQGDLLLLT